MFLQCMLTRPSAGTSEVTTVWPNLFLFIYLFLFAFIYLIYLNLLPLPKEVMFSGESVCLSVCLSLCCITQKVGMDF